MKNSPIQHSSWAVPCQLWAGHLPGTRARLIEILERVVRGDCDFTLGERVFVMACEFWVLAMNRELHQYATLGAVAKLQFAAIAYDSIGAAGVAGAVHAAHGDLVRPQTQAQRKRRLTMLEARLLLSAEPVDALLARAARELATADGVFGVSRNPPARSSPAFLGLE
jgi:hypothetical protein